jgi:DNA polymerase-3 subunit epsilon
VHGHYLFIDTETTGLPQKWDLPVTATSNWPAAVQVAWIIYDLAGHEVKRASHYISNNDVKIAASASKIHGLQADFLSLHGKDRKRVFQALADDLRFYNPIVIGHFMELDQKVLGADFHRLGKENVLEAYPLFCTMIATRHLVRNPNKNFLRLGDLYELLFHKQPPPQHNAVNDAEATAACFFALLASGDIQPGQLENQQLHEKQSPNASFKFRLGIFSAAI